MRIDWRGRVWAVDAGWNGSYLDVLAVWWEERVSTTNQFFSWHRGRMVGSKGKFFGSLNTMDNSWDPIFVLTVILSLLCFLRLSRSAWTRRISWRSSNVRSSVTETALYKLFIGQEHFPALKSVTKRIGFLFVWKTYF